MEYNLKNAIMLIAGMVFGHGGKHAMMVMVFQEMVVQVVKLIKVIPA